LAAEQAAEQRAGARGGETAVAAADIGADEGAGSRADQRADGLLRPVLIGAGANADTQTKRSGQSQTRDLHDTLFRASPRSVRTGRTASPLPAQPGPGLSSSLHSPA